MRVECAAVLHISNTRAGKAQTNYPLSPPKLCNMAVLQAFLWLK